jgi:hypothetical protein
MVEEKKLCYCCLSHNHFGRTCFRKRKYSFKECKKQHHYLLHEEDKKPTTFVSSNMKEMSLRTVPVILKNGDIHLVVNALLDDGST